MYRVCDKKKNKGWDSDWTKKINKMAEKSSTMDWDEHKILWEAVMMIALAAKSRRCVVADLESEKTCCRSEERVWGSQYWWSADGTTRTSTSRSSVLYVYVHIVGFHQLLYFISL